VLHHRHQPPFGLNVDDGCKLYYALAQHVFHVYALAEVVHVEHLAVKAVNVRVGVDYRKVAHANHERGEVHLVRHADEGPRLVVGDGDAAHFAAADGAVGSRGRDVAVYEMAYCAEVVD
jgi:hypothetical protein